MTKDDILYFLKTHQDELKESIENEVIYGRHKGGKSTKAQSGERHFSYPCSKASFCQGYEAV
jgi:hypothetical protein